MKMRDADTRYELLVKEEKKNGNVVEFITRWREQSKT
jgi:hypothetical protein